MTYKLSPSSLNLMDENFEQISLFFYPEMVEI